MDFIHETNECDVLKMLTTDSGLREYLIMLIAIVPNNKVLHPKKLTAFSNQLRKETQIHCFFGKVIGILRATRQFCYC